MTPSQAKEISKDRFIFGNPEHLEAVEIMEEVGHVVKIMLRCRHKLRTKLCSCLNSYDYAILVVAAEDPRLSPHWKSSVYKCRP